VKTETITYPAGTVEARGFLACDDQPGGKRPGVVVAPAWWGLNDYAKTRAKMLAQLGYVALAADLYGGGTVAADRKQAAVLAGVLKAGDRKELRARIAAALAQLKKDPRVDPEKTAAIGYCFGGTTVLELARSGAELRGVVTFHGGLDTQDPAQAGKVKAKILVCHGADDPVAPAAQVLAFEEEMRKAQVNWQMNLYGGAVHDFTNPGAGGNPASGVAYNQQADERSWREMQDFLREIFAGR
jgi:dienelactone hydrolase